MINKLTTKIENLQMEIQQTRIEVRNWFFKWYHYANELLFAQSGRSVDDLKRTVTELECNAVELTRALQALKIEKDVQSKELEEVKQELARHIAGTDIQTELVKAEAKFLKMKDVYNKLREEHIELLRKVSAVLFYISDTRSEIF